MGSSFRKPGFAGTLAAGVKEAMKVPGIEALATGVGGALLLRALASAGINAVTARSPENVDPHYAARLKNAATLVGSLVGLNPLVRAYSPDRNFLYDIRHRGMSDALDFTPFLGTIDIGTAARTIHQDAFLNPYEKSGVLDVVRSAPQVTAGKTSQYNLFKSAARAGVSFIPAYSFGMLAGKALGVPADTASHISRIGALAYAIRASGLTDQLGMG